MTKGIHIMNPKKTRNV